MKNYLKKNKKGGILILVLFVIALFPALAVAAAQFVLSELKQTGLTLSSTQAFYIAEAGVNYYKWVLAHDQEEFQDGTGGPGPYIHEFKNTYGERMGEFSLDITPPEQGSTIVTISSQGLKEGKYSAYRKIKIKLGISSLSKYAVVADDDMRFGAGTEVFGEIHANGGIRFDGVAHNLVSSTKECYDDPDYNWPNQCQRQNGTWDEKEGVWTSQSNPDEVFLAGTAYPVAPVDFNLISADFGDLREEAQTNGLYLGPSGRIGYQIILKPDNTADIYKVKRVSNRCWVWGFGWTETDKVRRRSSFTLNGRSSLNYPLDDINLIFVEDKLWLEGQINNKHLTIVAAKEPFATGNADIIINNDLSYTNYDGSDTLGIIAQRNISVGLYSENDLRIDGALLAQKGRIGRNYFPWYCSLTYYKRNSITTYGSLATNQRYGFSWVCGGSWCSGYHYRYLNFDSTLIFGPPPYFPTTGEYSQLSWEEE